MNILIDGCVFKHSKISEELSFWNRMLSRLPLYLQGCKIYYLNRGTDTNPPIVEEWQTLFAPPVNFQQAAIEDRRLAALCDELKIQVFLSTYNTSAGSRVASLVLVTKYTVQSARDCAIAASQYRAIHLASSYLAISQTEVDYLCQHLNVSASNIQVIYQKTPSSLDWDTIADACATAILSITNKQHTSAVTKRRITEETITQAQAKALRPSVYGSERLDSQLTSTEAKVPTGNILQTNQPRGEQLIPPEIKNDEFYTAIQTLARQTDIKTVLEIGSSSGEGSTEAFVEGLKQNPNDTILCCIEISSTRFAALQKQYAQVPFVQCYNVSSVSLEDLPNEREVVEFYWTTQTTLRNYPLNLVLKWLREGKEDLQQKRHFEKGIQKIKEENSIDYFDMVLIDGSEFTGKIELQQVYGSKYILLDDINSFKNYYSHRYLFADPNYELIDYNINLRNGYSIFKKIKSSTDREINTPSIHFLTIVLNGEPFIRYHIDVLKQLPFHWHWHIVEGVASLKYDTAWSLQCGGKITESIHRDGRSNDGTSEYLDILVQQYPEHITVYRKPRGDFWDGKREMVNTPLKNIHEECLLWQIDVDELWTFEQICEVRKIFIKNPEKTAAFYWCWYFFGEELIVSTRNCYTQNPQQEWLRTWRFKPGYFWSAHEPPVLVEPLPDGTLRNVATINPFTHQETESRGLVFQHFAYVLPTQLKFKEQYYGYTGALAQWQALQAEYQFPVLLRNHLEWVSDETLVDCTESKGIIPIAQKDTAGNWHFIEPQFQFQRGIIPNLCTQPVIAVDGVFFQYYSTGIARVWRSLLKEWVKSNFAEHILVLDRVGTAPRVPGIRYRTIPPHDYNDMEADRALLQEICDRENAALFISTYYSFPTSTSSVFVAYDMIPEVVGANFQEPMWKEKHDAIQNACAYLAISDNTARDLKQFFPEIESITTASCGVESLFAPASSKEVKQFTTKYGITKPYFLLVAPNAGYKNSPLFLQAFAKLQTRLGFEIISTGNRGWFDEEWRNYTQGTVVHTLQLNDEELRLAYAGAIALVYPSKYEGFGLPVLEALACGCPVITTPNASLPEVAGEAAIYVKDDDIEGMTDALCEVQKPTVRQSLIAKGLKRAKQFSWTKMAEIVSSALIDATLLPLQLREINFIMFPDWSQAEEDLGLELQSVIKKVATHPESDRMTLLVDTTGISEEDTNLLLSGVVMNLLMEEDIDVSESVGISLVGQLAPIQWEALRSHLQGKIVLEGENEQAIAQAGLDDLPTFSLDQQFTTKET